MMQRGAVARGVALLALLVAVLAAGFAWGYFAHRNQVFPYPLAMHLAFQAGVVKPPSPEDELGRPVNAAHAAVESLPYVSGTVDPQSERSGVYEHDPGRAAAGWSFFTPRLRPQAFLVAMDGEVVHGWRTDSGPWQHAELLADGGVLALVKDEQLIRLDRESNVLWSREGNFHHDLSVTADGRIHVLDRTYELRPEIHPELETVVDLVTVLSSDGELIEQISILDLVQESPYRFVLPSMAGREIDPTRSNVDILHTNHVEVFDGSLEHLSPLYRAGNLLLSMRTPSTVLIADPDAREVLWVWGPSNLVYQHHPTLLDDGHLLVFNNGVERSEVVELDPLNDRVAWRYSAEDFFSRTRGSVQRLPNGNTLITESDTGYVFEVTPDGERVWAFANPFFTDDGARMAMWRMTRFFSGDPRLPLTAGRE